MYIFDCTRGPYGLLDLNEINIIPNAKEIMFPYSSYKMK